MQVCVCLIIIQNKPDLGLQRVLWQWENSTWTQKSAIAIWYIEWTLIPGIETGSLWCHITKHWRNWICPFKCHLNISLLCLSRFYSETVSLYQYWFNHHLYLADVSSKLRSFIFINHEKHGSKLKHMWVTKNINDKTNAVHGHDTAWTVHAAVEATTRMTNLLRTGAPRFSNPVCNFMSSKAVRKSHQKIHYPKLPFRDCSEKVFRLLPNKR